MRADKDSIDYQVNLAALQEMEEAVPMNDGVSENGCIKAMKSNQIHGTTWILTECP